MNQVTIKDVALKAKVSTTTVSHVINSTRFVDPATRERVLDAMRQLGYQPNFLARSLRRGVSKTIGLIVPDASNLFFAEIARKIEDYGYQQGYSVILGNSDNDPEKQANYITTLLAKRVDGVIFISTGGEVEELMRFSENRVPVVVADRDVPLELADIVLLDNEQAGYDATRFLLEMGNRHIACITGPQKLSPSYQRMQGFYRAMRERNLDVDPTDVIAGDFQSQSGVQAMETLLRRASLPEAVFVFNDMMAIGAMTAVRKAGLSIPADISVIGFDDISLAAAITPALTTIAQPISEIARNATDLLIQRLEGTRQDENQRLILKASLVERESTCRRVR